jgi:hypothetical protein
LHNKSGNGPQEAQNGLKKHKTASFFVLFVTRYVLFVYRFPIVVQSRNPRYPRLRFVAAATRYVSVVADMVSFFPKSLQEPTMSRIILLLIAAITASCVPATTAVGQSALAGTIDIHVHSDPDSRPRSIDALEVARLARSKGMRGIVLKNHYDPTGGLAYLVRKEVPGLEVFGGVDLNLTVGGINPAAVAHMTEVSGGWGRIVWMPTFDAENQVRYSKENRAFVRVTQNRELLPEVKEVLALIAKHELALATGHLAPEETLTLLDEAKRRGVQRMVVTHAMNAPVLMTIAHMQQATRYGAFIEFVGGSLSTADAKTRIDGFADAIRKIGPEFSILSSDLGQRGNALPPDGFAEFIAAMQTRGFSEKETDLMSKRNPAKLLGLE